MRAQEGARRLKRELRGAPSFFFSPLIHSLSSPITLQPFTRRIRARHLVEFANHPINDPAYEAAVEMHGRSSGLVRFLDEYREGNGEGTRRGRGRRDRALPSSSSASSFAAAGPDPRALAVTAVSPFHRAPASQSGDPWRPDEAEAEALAAPSRLPPPPPHPPERDGGGEGGAGFEFVGRIHASAPGGGGGHAATSPRGREVEQEEGASAAASAADAGPSSSSRTSPRDPFFLGLYSTPRPSPAGAGGLGAAAAASAASQEQQQPPAPPIFPSSSHPLTPTALREALAAGDDARVRHLLDLLDYDVAEEDVAYAREVGAREEVVRELEERAAGGGGGPAAEVR